MAVTQEELESFHRFAAERLHAGDDRATLEELVRLWRTARERGEANAAIRQGVRDIENGSYRPLDDFMRDFRKKHNIADKG